MNETALLSALRAIVLLRRVSTDTLQDYPESEWSRGRASGYRMAARVIIAELRWLRRQSIAHAGDTDILALARRVCGIEPEVRT